MKQSKKVFLALLTLVCLLTSLIPLSSFAEPVNRKYIVRFSGGNIGSTSVPEDYVVGEGWVTLPSVKLNRSGYYLKGFVQSGRDPSRDIVGVEAENNPTNIQIKITQDEDYTAVYGVDGTQVQYTVQYLLNGTTTKLAPDGVFYASAGDVVISAHIDIDGYVPGLRSRKTISPDASQNVLYAYYTTPPTTATTAGGAAAGAAVAGAGAAVAGANAAGGAANAAANGANAANPVQANPANPTVAGANAVNPNAAAPAPQQQYAQTEDILDLDVPLAAPEGSALPSAAPAVPAISAPPVIQPQDANKTGLPTWALVGGGVVGVGLIALLYWYLLFYRKKKKYADIDDLFRE